ncbi:MAG: hypothetical protein ACRYG7_14890 [Janthinobacterium lividum]
MQSPAARRRVATATPAVPVAETAVRALPVLRLILANGVVEIEDPTTARELLMNEQRARLAAEAEQTALSMVYRLSGEPDESRPYGGLLTRRLDISERTARNLITEGRLKYTCLGLKGYRISEAAVRTLLGDLPSTK